MSLFQIPLMRRSTSLGDPNAFGKKVRCLHVDKVGAFIHYDDEKQLDINFIRKHLICRAETRCLIDADTAEKAINIFYEEWKGAKIGGESVPEEKALWINEKKEILEFPNCERLHKNKKGEFICGEQDVEGDTGIWGGCVLNAYDAPDDCPISQFISHVFDLKDRGRLPVEIIQGFKVVLAKNVAV